MPGPVRVVEYDPAWPRLYKAERERVLDAAGDRIQAIEHIGSTAVPGLGAKPIIDMMAGVEDSRAAEKCVELLKLIGYTDANPDQDHPEHFYCLGKGPHSVGYHLHLVKEHSRYFEDHILFRNYLRTHPDVAQQYFELKKKLAEEYEYNRRVYTESKTAFVTSVLSKARKNV